MPVQMKRDMDLCRSLLQRVEASKLEYDEAEVVWKALEQEGYSESEATYNAVLFVEAGLLMLSHSSHDGNGELQPLSGGLADAFFAFNPHVVHAVRTGATRGQSLPLYGGRVDRITSVADNALHTISVAQVT